MELTKNKASTENYSLSQRMHRCLLADRSGLLGDPEKAASGAAAVTAVLAKFECDPTTNHLEQTAKLGMSALNILYKHHKHPEQQRSSRNKMNIHDTEDCK